MPSELNDIRSNLRDQVPETGQNESQLGFILLLVGVIGLGGLIGFVVMPKSSAPSAQAAQVQTEPAPKPLSKRALKDMRRAELKTFTETQTQLLSCAQSQRHMMAVHQAYVTRNMDRRNAWYALNDPTQRMSKMAEMNQMEATAYMLTQGNGDVREMMQDITMQVNGSRRKIDPIKCGQLNSQVQRRELDLKPIPNG